MNTHMKIYDYSLIECILLPTVLPKYKNKKNE